MTKMVKGYLSSRVQVRAGDSSPWLCCFQGGARSLGQEQLEPSSLHSMLCRSQKGHEMDERNSQVSQTLVDPWTFPQEQLSD